MSRFYTNKESIDMQTGLITITGEDVNHIKNVLRALPGDLITVCDGEGTDFEAKIKQIDKNSIFASITGSKKCLNEPPVKVTLYQGIPKSDKMELIIQKCVELGVHEIVPVLNERTIVRFGGEKDKETKTLRWRKIAREAAKQCNRGIVPNVRMPEEFSKAVSNSSEFGLSLIAYEKEVEHTLRERLGELKKKVSQKAEEVAVFVGPEGGFTEKEIDEAILSGAFPVTLGPRILRTETAGLAVISVIMYELGDLS